MSDLPTKQLAGDELPVGAWALFEQWQFELNTLASVAIEMPALRPAFERMRDALD